MAGGWGLLVELCLPVPFVLLILLTVPAPRSFHRTVLTTVDRTLGVRFVGMFSLLHVMLIVTGVAFLATIRATLAVDTEQKGLAGGVEQTLGSKTSQLAKKWRNERNFWISFICFVMWCLLARLHKIMVDKARLEDRLRELSGPAGATKPTSTPPPAGAVPKKTS